MATNLPSYTDALDYLKGVTTAKLSAFAEEVNHFVFSNTLSDQERRPGSGSVQLSIALQRVFDPRNHKLLWEENADGSFRMVLFDKEIRFDSRHFSTFGKSEFLSLSQENEPLPAVRQGTGLSSTFGLLHARTKLNGEYWVVAILEMQQFLDRFSTEILDQLRDIENRFLLVLYETAVSRTKNEVTSPRERHPMEDRLLDGWLKDFGLDYGEPINADNIEQLEAKLEAIRSRKAPAILRVKATEHSGKTNEASKIVESSQGAPLINGKKIFSGCLDVLDDELTTLARNNSRILMVSPTLGGRTLKFAQEIPDQFSQVDQIDEPMLSWCAGAAAGGCHPFVLMTETELLRNLEQLSREICPAKKAITFLTGSPSNLQRRESSGTQLNHGSALSCIRLLPQMAVAAPRDEAELRGMLKLAQDYEGPLTLLLPEGSQTHSAKSPPTTPIRWGQSEILSTGQDVVLLAVGTSVALSVQVAKLLEIQGISATVVNLRFLKPLDVSLIDLVTHETQRIFVLAEEAENISSLVRELFTEHNRSSRITNWETSESSLSILKQNEKASLLAKRIQSQLAEDVRSVIPAWQTPASIEQESSYPGLSFRFSRESALEERALIQAKTLSPLIDEWVSRYEQVGQRTRYLWQWCLQGLELITFSGVDPKWRAHACDTKLLAVILGVVFDDVADRQKDSRYLEELLRITTPNSSTDFSHRSLEQQKHARFTHELWDIYQQRIQEYPLYQVYAELLNYDHQQIFNSMRYAQLINGNLSLLNLVEHDMYLPHNMQMMSFASIDLMCSPSFDVQELGKLREAMWHAQCMGRIGNLVSTWQREIGDKDFTSGVFARSIMKGDLSLEKLNRFNPEQIEAAIQKGGHETHFLHRWKNHYNRIKSLQPEVQSLDLGELLAGLERLIHMELGSRGLK